jgi:UPF0755 protein
VRTPLSLLPNGLPPERRFAVMALSAAATLGVALVLMFVASLWVYHGSGPKAPKGDITNVVLRPGAGLSEIASTLDRAGVVRSGPIFAAAAQITGSARSLKAGEYEFPSRASMAAVLRKIRNGEVVRHTVTIPEGLTSEMVVDILMANPILSGAVPVPEEGTILPETYEVRRGEDRAEVLRRMTEARNRLLAQLWAQRKEGLPYATPQEAVILASIVEKETSKAPERPHVAAVYLNRLRIGMRLGADPTVIYGITRGRPLGHGIRQSELDAVTPYNTYASDGLPAGPICNPGRASLAAVLDPATSDDIYFVADGTGGHVFAATAEEHLRNVSRWRQVEKTNPAWTSLPAVNAPAPTAAPANRGK